MKTYFVGADRDLLKVDKLRAVKKINRSQPGIYMNKLNHKTIEAIGFEIAGVERP